MGDALQQLGFKQIPQPVTGTGHEDMAQNPHHLVISDFNMQKWMGSACSRPVRANPATKKAAFIILTAQGDALVQKAAALGANNVLAKPFTIEKMKAAIEAVFGALK